MKVTIITRITAGDHHHDLIVDIMAVTAGRGSAVRFLEEHFGSQWANWKLQTPTAKNPDTTWKHAHTTSFITLGDHEVLP